MSLRLRTMDYFTPTEAYIAERCRIIREQGWYDRKGLYHPPWSDDDMRLRRLGRLVESRTNRMAFHRVRLRARVSQRRLMLRTMDRIAVALRGSA